MYYHFWSQLEEVTAVLNVLTWHGYTHPLVCIPLATNYVGKYPATLKQVFKLARYRAHLSSFHPSPPHKKKRKEEKKKKKPAGKLWSYLWDRIMWKLHMMIFLNKFKTTDRSTRGIEFLEPKIIWNCEERSITTEATAIK